MTRSISTALTAGLCAVTFALGGAAAQPPQGQQPAPVAQSARGSEAGRAFAAAVDLNKDGGITRTEMNAAFDRWFTAWDTAKAGTLTQEQLLGGMSSAMRSPASAGGRRGQNPPPQDPGPQNQTANPAHVAAMVAALPATAPVKPRRPRRVLVLARAVGYVHSTTPLAARTIEEMGKKTGAWSTTITYDAADITEKNLKQYDAIFLASTTGEFLDDPKDAAATAARRKAFLDFVRSGKGLAGIHAASDAYHETKPAEAAPAAGGPDSANAAPIVARLAAEGDKDNDQRLSRAELAAVSDPWFDKIDTEKFGRVSQTDFAQRFSAIVPSPEPPPAAAPRAAPSRLGPDREVGTWPDFNRMIGGFFKFHWNDGQQITYKIDEPDHPLNAPFKKLNGPFVVVDETYTFGRETYSRQNLRVLTSVDYAKMSAEDKAKEHYPREDGDYALSWIRRDGKGRVFYMAHGHNERVYAITPLLEHLLYGMQYALGDLPADDTPRLRTP